MLRLVPAMMYEMLSRMSTSQSDRGNLYEGIILGVLILKIMGYMHGYKYWKSRSSAYEHRDC